MEELRKKEKEILAEKQGKAREEALAKLAEENSVAENIERLEADKAAESRKEALDRLVTKGLLENIILC